MAIGVVASVLVYQQDRMVLFVISVVATIGEFWSFGVMHNFAMDAARTRRTFRGGFYDITPQEAESAANWLAVVNFAFTLIAAGLLVFALFDPEWL